MNVIAITGVAGLVGRHLALHLLRQNHTVIGIDDLSTGSARDLDALSSYPKFMFVHSAVHLVDPYWFSGADMVYHLACTADPEVYYANPNAPVLANVDGTRWILEHAKGRVLFASSSEVYGSCLYADEKTPTATSPWSSRAGYVESKRMGETLMRIAHDQGKDVRVARIFNVFGPGSTGKNRLIPRVIRCALTREVFPVYGEGTQIRSWAYVGDTVRGLVALMLSDVRQPVNIGDPRNALSNLEVVRAVEHIVDNGPIEIEYRPAPEHEPTTRIPDIHLARQKLEWTPEVDFTVGLTMVVDYWRSVYA